MRRTFALSLWRAALLDVAASAPLTGRHAHWVLRTSNLSASVEFYKEVFGMRVLRHEENPGACPITCNGRYATAWSKTMMGYETEDKAYALELTYNYGVPTYEPGEALRSIGACVPATVDSALAAATRLGYSTTQDAEHSAPLVVGPDNYRYELLARSGENPEPFRHVRLQVQDLKVSNAFYTDFLGMTEHEGALGYIAPNGKGSVGAFAGAPLLLSGSITPSVPVRVEQWEGRHAVTLPANDLRRVYARFQASAPQLIVHELRELQEQLGTLLILIVKDPDGLELCLVSAEVFDPAVKAAADFREPDWEQRRLLDSEQAEVLRDTSPAPWASRQ